jgi:transcriptional regulator GlxA family with amidase domain
MRATTIEQHSRLREVSNRALARGLYREPITVAEMARRLCVSPRTLQRAYAQGGTTTFIEELRAVRLRAGAELLAEQAIAVADVARLVGYRSPPAFAAAFTRRYGMSPAVFRATARLARTRPARGPPVIRRPRAAIARGS